MKLKFELETSETETMELMDQFRWILKGLQIRSDVPDDVEVVVAEEDDDDDDEEDEDDDDDDDEEEEEDSSFPPSQSWSDWPEERPIAPEEEVDTLVSGFDATPAAMWSTTMGDSVLPPPPEQKPASLDKLPKLSASTRADAWKVFIDLCDLWRTNYNIPDSEQPDRLDALRTVGSGRSALPILVIAYEIGSLQRMVEQAYQKTDKQETLDFCDQIAANMIQISHMVFPDLAGTYDYSTKWRRG